MKFKMLTGKVDRRQYTRESADNSLSAGLYLFAFGVWSLGLNLAPGLERPSVFMELF